MQISYQELKMSEYLLPNESHGSICRKYTTQTSHTQSRCRSPSALRAVGLENEPFDSQKKAHIELHIKN